MSRSESGPHDATRLIFVDPQVAADLRTFVSRARATDDGAVRLQASQGVLAAYVCLLKPRTLGEGTPTVLGLRTMPLAGGQTDIQTDIDVTVSLAAVADRLARMGPEDVVLPLPAVTVSESWAGIAAPRTGWSLSATVTADELEAAARRGIREVAELVPSSAGPHLVDAARAAVWGRAMPEVAPDLPAGAAFAALTLGFLTPEQPAGIYRSGRWLRISTPRGHVLVRAAAAL